MYDFKNKIGIMLMKKIAQVIDEETGVLDTMGTFDLRDGDMLSIKTVRAESIKAFNEKQKKRDDIEEWEMLSFFKGHIPELREINKELNTYEKSLLFSILPYISYADCLIQHDNGKPVKMIDISKISGLDKRSVIKYMDSLREKDIVYFGKNSLDRQYFVNPWLFCKGKVINKVLKTMFQNYKIKVKGNIEWKNLRAKDMD